jgi:hypothetical protein
MTQETGYMQQHLCTCMIDIANEKLQIVARDATNPVTWPEIRVLQSIHGEDAIYDIEPVALGPRESPSREKERLQLRYGTAAVEAVYAGRAFVMEWFMPGWPIDPTKNRKKKKSDRPHPPRYRQPDAEAVDANV